MAQGTHEKGQQNPQHNAQQVRDTRRVLQVLLPGLPPPAIEMAVSTVFASTGLSSSARKGKGGAQGANAQQKRSPSGRYTIKRMDSGDFSQLSLTSPPTNLKSGSKRFEEPSQLQFNLPESKKR